MCDCNIYIVSIFLLQTEEYVQKQFIGLLRKVFLLMLYV